MFYMKYVEPKIYLGFQFKCKNNEYIFRDSEIYCLYFLNVHSSQIKRKKSEWLKQLVCELNI